MMTNLAREWLQFISGVYAMTNPNDAASLCLVQKWAHRGTPCGRRI